MSTTANAIITGALRLLGVIDSEDTPDASMAAIGFRTLNLMMGSWSLQPQTIPCAVREVFNIVANQQSYTIGPGGNFNTTRPAELAGAALVLTTSTPTVEVPLTLFTDDAYQGLAVKDLSNGQPTGVYYEPTFAGGLGTVTLWPVPDNGTHDLVLYRAAQLGPFVSLVASYDLPGGAELAIQYTLTAYLAPVYTVPVPPSVALIARNSLRVYKRSNVKLSDLAQDTLVGNRRGGYNILTGG